MIEAVRSTLPFTLCMCVCVLAACGSGAPERYFNLNLSVILRVYKARLTIEPNRKRAGNLCDPRPLAVLAA